MRSEGTLRTQVRGLTVAEEVAQRLPILYSWSARSSAAGVALRGGMADRVSARVSNEDSCPGHRQSAHHFLHPSGDGKGERERRIRAYMMKRS